MIDPYAKLAGVYDEIVVDPCHPVWAQFLDRLWAGDAVHRVLDLCCGSGLMAAELRKRNLEVVGVDASAAMLERARTLLGPEVTLVEAFLPELPVTGPFDAVVSTLDGLSYLSPTDFGASMRAIAGILRPGGWLVFDLHGEAMLDFAEHHAVITGTEHGEDFTLTTTVDRAVRTCTTTIQLHGSDHAFSEQHVQFIHANDDVRAALDAAGFEAIVVTDEYTDTPATAATLRATWVARRTP